MTTPATAEKPAFSFSNLTVEDATVPRIRRESSVQENPFLDIVKATYDLPEDDGKSITVPADKTPQAVYLLRGAAAQLGYGIRIAFTDRNGNTLGMGAEGGTVNSKGRTVGSTAIVVRENGQKFNGNVRIIFKAKPKKERHKSSAS
ncbi:MAG TPA: hypothetical protein VFI97_03540 [Arthrobacter sp.]|nr:hypothetical protein [Arthrobacter sp.]